MGTITEVKSKSGKGPSTWCAQIRIQRGGVAVYSDSKTFKRKEAARTWMKKREADLDKPGGLARAIAAKAAPRKPTLGDAIERTLTGRVKEVGRTTKDNLRIVQRRTIAAMACEDVKSTHLSDLAQELYDEGRLPATVGNILSSLGKVFTLADPLWGYPLDEREMAKAVAGCRELGMIERSAKRKRRPELDELDRLMEHFEAYEKRRSDALPMRRLTAFGIYSTRRLSETCRILWKDYQPEHKDGPRIKVRDMKHPGEKKGNDAWCRLTPEAVAMIEAMPRVDARIFPYSAETASTNWTRACEVLRIEDLEFRDLRRDGISRLLEMGRDISVVREYSGHRTLAALEHYVALKEIDSDKYGGWQWLPVVTEPFTPSSAAILSARRRAARQDMQQGLAGR